MTSFLTRQFRSLAPIFKPPFDGLWLLVVLYYLWCFFVHPHSQILRGNLPDPDDYMYLTQVLDWMNGQGWYDNLQHRLNPPDGVPIHFSRFAQLPMAIFIMLFRTLGMTPRGAATLMAVFYPIVLLTGFLFAVRWLAQSFMPKNWSGVTAYVTLFATGTMFMFMPGHVDHHGLVVISMVLALGCIVRMMGEPENPVWGFSAGLILAFGLTIALEILPWLLVIATVLGCWAVAKGGLAARNGLAFGLSLYLGSAFFLLLTRPPHEFFIFDILTYSCVYVLLTGGIAVAFAGVAASAKTQSWVRWCVGVGLAALTGFLFLHRFPELVTGPYGAIDPQLVPLILDEVQEAQPLIKLKDLFFQILTHLGRAAVALGVIMYFLRRSKDQKKWQWGLMLAMLATATFLTFFYQYRFMAMMGMLTIVPLAVLLQRGWQWVGKHYEGRRKVFAELGLLFLVGPFSVLVPAVVDGRSFNGGVLLFPVDSSVTHSPCDTFELEKILRNPQLYGNRQHLILTSMGQGPEILFRTPHTVLSAPYHMDVSGNIDATRFFSTPYAEEAEAIARRRHADLVVACRFVPYIYTRAPDVVRAAKGNDDSTQDSIPHFAELLMNGRAPSWLRRMDFPSLANYVIYEVLPPEQEGKKPRRHR